MLTEADRNYQELLEETEKLRRAKAKWECMVPKSAKVAEIKQELEKRCAALEESAAKDSERYIRMR